MPLTITKDDVTKDDLTEFMDNGAALFHHAARLNQDGKIDQAIELIERVESYQQGALEMLYEMATIKAENTGHALIKLIPKGDREFLAQVKDGEEWREFASGPFTQLLKAIVALGYSTTRIEERFIVPIPKGTISHTFLLDRLKTA